MIRSGAPISRAMIMARVVLPSPGGPDSSTWSALAPRSRAARSTRPELGLAPGPGRRTPRGCGDAARPSAARSSSSALAVEQVLRPLMPDPGVAGPSAGGPAPTAPTSTAMTASASSATACRGRAGVPSRPAQGDQAVDDGRRPVRAEPAAPRFGRPRCAGHESVLELQGDPGGRSRPMPGRPAEGPEVVRGHRRAPARRPSGSPSTA